MMKTISKILKALFFLWTMTWPLSIMLIVSSLLIYWFSLDIGKINDNDFLFSFLGILLGFALTIFSFIIPLIEKFKEKEEIRLANDPTKLRQMKNNLRLLYAEIKDNIKFTFLSLIIVSSLYVVNYQIPAFGLFGDYYFSHLVFVESLKLSLFILNLYAIYDLIIVSFRIVDTTGIFR